MLVLSRREGEETVCVLPSGEELVVKVVVISGNRVKLGFDVPKDVRVMRREIYELDHPKTLNDFGSQT